MSRNIPRLEWKERLTSELVASQDNPRTLDAAAFKALKQSLAQDPDFIKARPLLVTMAEGRKNTVIAGNMRLQAVQALGWVTVSVVEVYDATEEQEQEWMLKDNLHRGEWDFDKLANGFELDFLKDAGFGEKHLDKILGKVDHGEDDEFDVEEAVKPVVKRGEVWKLGDHRIMCGDSTSREDVAKLLDGRKAERVFTDPPYNVDYSTSGYERARIACENLNRVCYGMEISEHYCDVIIKRWEDKTGKKAKRVL